MMMTQFQSVFRSPLTPYPGGLTGVRFGRKKASGLDASIPVLDLAQFRKAQTNSERNAFARDFGTKFQQYGFIALKNHGVPRQLIDKHVKAFDGVLKRPETELTK